jgi:hypothetical protein
LGLSSAWAAELSTLKSRPRWLGRAARIGRSAGTIPRYRGLWRADDATLQLRAKKRTLPAAAFRPKQQ